MSWYSRSSKSDGSTATAEIVHDDGGTGLFAAATERFGPHGCEIVCDAKHTVWVKRADTGLSVGLSPWMLGRYSVDELLEDVKHRLTR